MSHIPSPNPEETRSPADIPRADVTPAPEAVPPTYRWTYAEQASHERAAAKKKNRRGLLTYSIVLSAVFLISLGLLIAVIALGGGNGDSMGGILRPGINDSANDKEAVVGVEQAKRSVVVIEVTTEKGGGTGTGIIMTSDGYIATNHHVVDDANKIKVTFHDQSVAYAELVGSSEMDDLAVIKVNTTGLPAATFAHSDECYQGQTVYAIGTPAGAEFGWTTTKGIISYTDREVRIYDDDGSLQKKLRLLQTDAMVNPGNSGGPLINTAGEVVGVVSMKLTDGYEGIGFAIPSDGAVEILEAIMKYGNADSINSSLHHKRPMLGITGVYVEGGVYYLPDETGVKPIPEEELGNYDMASLLHPAVSGIYVMGFADGMDAAGKMQVGDIVTAAEGEKLSSMAQLSGIINDFYAGDTVTLTVYRNGADVDVKITLSAKPD
jgi:serine protease Do